MKGGKERGLEINIERKREILYVQHYVDSVPNLTARREEGAYQSNREEPLS